MNWEADSELALRDTEGIRNSLHVFSQESHPTEVKLTAQQQVTL